MERRWSIAPSQPSLAAHLAEQLAISPLLAQCLLNRGFTEPEPIRAFLQPRLRDLRDPFFLPDMTAAVERLLAARERDEPVTIFGDYDVDGVTSTALLAEFLGSLGWRVNWHLPHRMDEGYGLSQDGVENCLQKHRPTLLLAVDCGSTAAQTIAWLKQRGVDVIVLDHHQVSNPAPGALALVNPQLGQHASFTELCSAGLAFKLAHALLKKGRETGLPGAGGHDLRPLLDLVALGTIADLVPLTGENRILASAGLERLNSTQRPGLVALKRIAQVREPVGVYEVGFQLAPRLNAAGRLETAEAALRLLLARDETEALPLAQALDSQNRERQEIERNIVEQAAGAVRATFDPARHYVIVEGQMLWHIGVVGIVASRMVREFYRPTIILGGDAAEWRGSGRSIEGFDLAAALRQCDDLLLRHGGHAMAAGLSVHPDNVEALRERLNAVARRTLAPQQLKPVLKLDAEVPLAELALECVEQLGQLAPMGQGNPPVQLACRNLSHRYPPRRMGRDRQHLKLWVTDGRACAEAVWWNAPENEPPRNSFDLAFAPAVNEYNGRRSVQLRVLDCRAR